MIITMLYPFTLIKIISPCTCILILPLREICLCSAIATISFSTLIFFFLLAVGLSCTCSVMLWLFLYLLLVIHGLILNWPSIIRLPQEFLLSLQIFWLAHQLLKVFLFMYSSFLKSWIMLSFTKPSFSAVSGAFWNITCSHTQMAMFQF